MELATSKKLGEMERAFGDLLFHLEPSPGVWEPHAGLLASPPLGLCSRVTRARLSSSSSLGLTTAVPSAAPWLVSSCSPFRCQSKPHSTALGKHLEPHAELVPGTSWASPGLPVPWDILGESRDFLWSSASLRYLRMPLALQWHYSP